MEPSHSFQELFSESGGKPIQFNGRELHLGEWVQISSDQQVCIRIESTNSEWRQGIELYINGEVEIDGQVVEVRKSMVFWEDTAPALVAMRVRAKDDKFFVNNIWDTGSGSTESWVHGAAMMIEVDGKVRRYRCNDGHPTATFDHIVFRIDVGCGKQ